MRTLTDARTDLVAALAATGRPVITDTRRIVPPCYIVAAAQPWLTGGDTFASAGIARFEVHAVQGRSVDDVALAGLEALVLDAWGAADTLTEFSAPFYGVLGENTYLAATGQAAIPLD